MAEITKQKSSDAGENTSASLSDKKREEVLRPHFARARRIQYLGIGYGILFLILGGIIFRSWTVVLGVFLGALIMVVDFFWLTRLVRQAFLMKGKPTGGFFLKFGLKFIFLLAIVALVIYFTPMNPIAFLVGLSVSVFGIVTDGIIRMFRVSDEGEG